MISWKRSGVFFPENPASMASSVSNQVRASTRDLHVFGTSRLEAFNSRQITLKNHLFLWKGNTQKASQKSVFFSSREKCSKWVWCWLVLVLWWDNSWWHIMVQFYSKQWRTLWDKGRKKEKVPLVRFQSQIFPGKPLGCFCGRNETTPRNDPNNAGIGDLWQSSLYIYKLHAFWWS